jgi:hypothetical protein
MNRKARKIAAPVLYAIVATALCAGQAFSQDKTREDLAVLSLLKEHGAFLRWQSNWTAMQPGFDLTKFQLASQERLQLAVLDSFKTFDMAKIDHPGHVAVSPDGSRLIGYGYAEYCGDDYCSIRLYDLRLRRVLELSAVQPPLRSMNGLSWLNDELVVIVGVAPRMKEGTPAEAVAASVAILDLRERTVHVFTGASVPAKQYLSRADRSVTVEPDLMLEPDR